MDRDPLTERILDFLDGQLSEEEERALAKQIRGDAEAEKLLADLMRLHGGVAAALSEIEGQKSAEEELEAITPPGGTSRRLAVSERSESNRALRLRARRAGPGPTPSLAFALGGAAAAVLLIVLIASMPTSSVPSRPMTSRPKKIIGPEVAPLPPVEMSRPPMAPMPVPKKEALVPAPPPPLPSPSPREEPLPTKRDETPIPTPPQPRVTVAEEKPKAPPAIAQIERVRGEVIVIADGAKFLAGEASGILHGQSLATIGADSAASLKYLDGTQVELAGDTKLSQLVESPAGKRVMLDKGAAVAQVAKQPSGQAMVFATPHAEARVLGTTLKLSVDPQGTKLEVTEGRVRLTRRSDGASVEVGAGYYAVAAPGPRPFPRKIGVPMPGRFHLLEDFEDAAAVKTRWQALEGGFPATTTGALDLDVSPRPGDSYAGGGWHLAGGLRTKQGFPLPIRVTVDVELSVKDDNVNALIVFVPSTQKGGSLKNEIAVRLRGGEYAVLVEGQKAKSHDSSWKPPLRERWTIEVDRTEVKLLVDGKEVQRHAHGLTITEEYRVELQGSAKLEAPKGSRVRFDNVKIEP